jgi:hypothetical protein
MEPTGSAHQEQATQELVSAAVGDRCANCQAPLASDQRFCVSCGERRGQARFSFEALAAKAAPAPSPPAPPRRRPHVSSSFSFILGVATLLLALGVGVLIGHNNNPKTTQAAVAPQRIVVQGGLGNSGPAKTSSTPNAGSFKATKIPKLTTKVVKKVQAAAAKVLGSGTNLSKNVTQQVGGSCSGGSGCQGGKFTGNFFSGG